MPDVCPACCRPLPSNQGRARRILGAVARHYKVPLDRILSPERARLLIRPRLVAAYLIREMLGWSLPEIGRAMGRDHSTVHHAIRRAESLIHADPAAAAEIEQIRVGVYVAMGAEVARG